MSFLKHEELSDPVHEERSRILIAKELPYSSHEEVSGPPHTKSSQAADKTSSSSGSLREELLAFPKRGGTEATIAYHGITDASIVRRFVPQRRKYLH